MEFAIEFLTNLVYAWSFVCVGRLFFDFEEKNKKYQHIICVTIILVTTILWFYVEVWAQAIAHVISINLILWLLFRERKRTLMWLYIGVTGILAMLELMIEVPISTIDGYFKHEIWGETINLLSQVIVLLFLIAIGYYFKRKYPNGLRKIGTRYLCLLATMLLIDATITVVLGHFVMDMLDIKRQWIFRALYIGVVIGILIQIVLLINALITRNVYKENEALAKRYLDVQNEHYLYLENKEKETKKFRHDIKNHLLLLEDFIQKKDYRRAAEYLEALNERVNAFGSQVSTNNSIVDAIVNKAYAEAVSKGIELRVTGHFPQVCSISAYDLCTVLSNLLTNAIFAEYEAEGSVVTLDIRYTEDEVYLVIENDYKHELRMENGTFQTTHTEAQGHGFGLVNVKECVERNGGDIFFATDNQKFKVTLSMRNEQKEIL